MRHEVHLHADIPILEGVSRRQIEQALAPLLEYLDADGLADVKSLEQDEPGFKYDEKELILYVCWTGEVGRSFDGALDAALEALGPYCYEAVEIDLTVYHENGEQESKLLFAGPTAQAIHEAQRRCMLEDIAAILARQFAKQDVAQVTALVNELFDRDWKEKAAQKDVAATLRRDFLVSEERADKLSGAWGRHPLLGRMYLPAYRAGTEVVAELRRKYPPEKVVPALYACKGLVDVVTIHQALSG